MMNDRFEQRAMWGAEELATLRQLIGLELPMSYIARKLHRPENSVRRKAHRIAIADMMGPALEQNRMRVRGLPHRTLQQQK